MACALLSVLGEPDACGSFSRHEVRRFDHKTGWRFDHKQAVYWISGLQFNMYGLVSCGWVMDVGLQKIFPLRSSLRLLAWMLAAGFAVAWLLFRKSAHVWLLQDMLACGFLCAFQRLIRLPSLKMATLLLCLMTIYDIFWVFISPLIFQKSVMMEVAISGLPVLLIVPSFDGKFSGLGFGDVALPGLLASCLLRFHLQSGKRPCNGYLIPSVIGYLAGVASATVGTNLMRCGQPALLYLVPMMLIVVFLLGAIRGDLGLLWQGFSSECFSGKCMSCGSVIHGMPVKQNGFICHFGCIDHSQAWERADGLQPPEQTSILLAADV